MSAYFLQERWDADKDGSISWDEALHEFNNIFRSMINSKKDHWVQCSYDIDITC